MTINTFWRPLGLICCGAIASCSQSNDRALTVYVSADDYVAKEVFNAFTEQTSISINWVGDTEALKTTALVQRLIKEKEHPVADVFWSSDIMGALALQSAGVLEPCQTSVTLQWPSTLKDTGMHWFAFSPRARVIAFNPAVENRSELPTDWWSYASASFADPRFGTTGTHFAVMSRFENRFKEFEPNLRNTPMLGGNAATVQAVIDGRVRFAMTDSDDVFAAQARGHSIDYILPRHDGTEGGGTLYIPNVVCLIRGARHNEEAKAFINFMLSDKVARLLAKSHSKNFPVQPSVQLEFPNLQMIDPLVVEWEDVFDVKEQVISGLMESIKSNH